MNLARAAGKQANRFLYARGLQKADRDDVISAALLWCWLNRANYSLTTTLETWFMNAVRHAYRDMRKQGIPSSEDSVALLSGGDDTQNISAAESSANALLGSLKPIEQEIALLKMQGFTYREINKLGYAKKAIDDASKRLKQLRRFMPEQEVRHVINSVTSKAPSLDDYDEVNTPQFVQSKIDKQIAQLDFAPPAGKDCPPCWRCMWFEGFMPGSSRSTRLDIEDDAVREAVSNTEARKIEIAQQVRDGNF